MNDLKIMLRVLLLVLFIGVTIIFAKAFIIVFWCLVLIGIIVGFREAKNAENKRISDAVDDLDNNRWENLYKDELSEMDEPQGTPFDEDLYSKN